jgi:DNA repair exonuclease SbcCD ATPase subunit
LKAAADDISLAKDHLIGHEATLNTLGADAAHLLDDGSAAPLGDAISAAKDRSSQEISALDQQRRAVTDELRALDLRLEGRRKVVEASQAAVDALATSLHRPTSDEPNALIARAAVVKQELDEEMKQLDGLRSVMPDLEDQLTQVGAILDYLGQKSQVEQLEANQPEAEQRLEQLNNARQRLADLQAGLEDIYAAATNHQRELLEGAMTTLLTPMNALFEQLQGHPRFSRLELQPEENKGTYLYWLVARDLSQDYQTYVPTRFSNTQLNIAALSIFFAIADRSSGGLDLLVLDDPTQSMDMIHKEALSRVLDVESSERQIFVASEDNEFRTALSNTLGERLTILELAPWDERGAQLLPNQPG